MSFYRQTMACIDAQKRALLVFIQLWWNHVSPVCSNSWDVKCEEWQMSCCVSPNWGGGGASSVDKEVGMGRKPGCRESKTQRASPVKSRTRNTGFLFPYFSRQTRSSSSSFHGCTRNQPPPLTEGSSCSMMAGGVRGGWLALSLFLSPWLCLFFMRTRTLAC